MEIEAKMIIWQKMQMEIQMEGWCFEIQMEIQTEIKMEIQIEIQMEGW